MPNTAVPPRQIILHDAAGIPRALLGMSSNGGPVVSLHAPTGEILGTVVVLADGTLGVSLVSAGVTRAVVTLDESGAALVCGCDPAGNEIFKLRT